MLSNSKSVINSCINFLQSLPPSLSLKFWKIGKKKLSLLRLHLGNTLLKPRSGHCDPHSNRTCKKYDSENDERQRIPTPVETECQSKCGTNQPSGPFHLYFHGT